MKRLDELGVSPAPWRAEEISAVSAYVLDGDDKAVFFGLADNARLCAAAPSLYEALAAMLSCAEKNAPHLDMSHMDIAMDMARKAIRKAGGEE